MHSFVRRIFIIITAVFGLFISHAAAANQPVLRVASFHTVLTEIVREIGGEQVMVTNVLPSEVDPHTYEPSPIDLRTIINADLTLAAGLKLESYLDRMLAKIKPKGKVFSAGDMLPPSLQLCHQSDATGHDHHDHDHGEIDPHWWHSIDATMFVTSRLRDELISLRPDAAEVFTQRATIYLHRLAELKTWAQSEVARLPQARRQLVTTHDALSYLGRDFGFTVHTISGLSTESEPDARHLARLIDLIRKEKIKVVFVETSANARIVNNLIAESGARIGGTLYTEGPEGDAHATYDTMYRHNLQAIVSALLSSN